MHIFEEAVVKGIDCFCVNSNMKRTHPLVGKNYSHSLIAVKKDAMMSSAYWSLG